VDLVATVVELHAAHRERLSAIHAGLTSQRTNYSQLFRSHLGVAREVLRLVVLIMLAGGSTDRLAALFYISGDHVVMVPLPLPLG